MSELGFMGLKAGYEKLDVKHLGGIGHLELKDYRMKFNIKYSGVMK